MKRLVLLLAAFTLACDGTVVSVVSEGEQGPEPQDVGGAREIEVTDAVGAEDGASVGAEDVALDDAPLETFEAEVMVECTVNSDCWIKGLESACMAARCKEGRCVPEPRPEGEACKGVEVPPCRTARCDGKGTCVEGNEDDGAPCTPASGAEPCTSYACASGACVGHSTCDDKDPCTADACDGEVCVHQPLNEGLCDDNNACTQGDHCFAGICMGEQVSCDDNDPCTLDGCLPEVGCTHDLHDDAPCDDGNPCTVNDYCKDGKCKGGAVLLCDDHNPCTDDGCSKVTGGCIYVPNVNPCDDHDPCTAGDRCEDGLCKGNEAVACEDGNACTEDYCDPSTGCVHTITPGCQPCTADPDCNDGNPCTKDVCAKDSDGELKCENTAITGGPCDDNKPCTVGDECVEGVCVGGQPKACDDGNICTDDSCDPTSGACLHTPNTRACDDNNLCTNDDACRQGQCAGNPVPCDDKNPCTSDSCDPSSGSCKFVPNSAPCDDSNKCTVNDHCAAGGCFGTLVSCDDQDACTVDSCDPKTGCVHQTIVGCKSCASDSQCDDQNPCTEDRCKDKACVFTKLTATPCEDGNPCTTNDTCAGGKCTPGNPTDCNDNNPCTADSCDQVQGCMHLPVGGMCDDNDPCTGPDACANGVCAPGPNLCCEGKPDGTPCSDQNGATVSDVCLKGVCKGFVALEFQAVPGADTYLEDVDASGEQAYVVGGYKSGTLTNGFVAKAPFGAAPEVIVATKVSGKMYRKVSYEAAIGDGGLVAYRLTFGTGQWYVGGELYSKLSSGLANPLAISDVFGLSGTYWQFIPPPCKADTYLFVGQAANGYGFARSCRIEQRGVFPGHCDNIPQVVCGTAQIQGPPQFLIKPSVASGEPAPCPQGECMMPAVFAGLFLANLAIFEGNHMNSGGYYDDFTMVSTTPVNASPLGMVKTGDSYLLVGEDGLLGTTKVQPSDFQVLSLPLEPQQFAWVFRSASAGKNVLAVVGMTYEDGTRANLLLHWTNAPLGTAWTVLPVATCQAQDPSCEPVELTGVAVRDTKIWLVGRKTLKTGQVVGVLYFLDVTA